MDSRLTKVALLTTSDRNDLRMSKGSVFIPGLNSMRKDDIIDAFPILQQDEVSQVVTIGGTTDPTITADTVYIIAISQAGERVSGFQDSQRLFKHRTPATLSGNAATDRQNVYDSLATKINAASDLNITASAGTGGTAMTLTDDAGYYANGRLGASAIDLLLDADGLGFIDATHKEVSTDAVYAFGVGADLLNDNPVISSLTGNLTSGKINHAALADAVSGQDYNAFFFESLVKVNDQTSLALESFKRHRQVVYVDNGLGSATTNAAGYAEFLREFERVMYGLYSGDFSSMISFVDSKPVFAGVAGGAPTGSAGDENIIDFVDARFTHHVLGTQTILAPTWDTDGLDLVQDAGDNDGSEISAPIEVIAPQQFVVGDGVCSFRTEFSIGDVSDTDDFVIGLRKKEAYQANVDDYDEMAAFNVNAGDIFIETILNGGATTSTDTTDNWADGETHTLEIQVDEDGVVTYLIDDAAPTTTAAFTFDAGEVLIPFVYYINAGATDPDIKLKKWFAVPAVIDRTPGS